MLANRVSSAITLVRPVKIRHYLNCMKRRGFPEDAVLADSMIEKSKLHNADYLIDVWQVQRVIRNMIELTGNKALGLEIGREIQFSDFGIVGYALMASASMREVINLWMSYSQSLVGLMLRIDLVERPDSWRVTFSEIVPLGEDLLRFCAEENLTFGQWIGESVVGEPIIYSSVEFNYTQPGDLTAYRDIFKGPLVFGAPVTAVNVISPSIEVRAPEERDPELFEACQRYCHQILRDITAGRPLALQIRSIFLRSGGRVPTLEDVAEQLHYSTRSFRRHLLQEGATYRELVNEFRCDLTKEYLKSGCLSNQQISDLLGYEESKAFLRAFKSWTGQTVSQYRATLRQG